MGRNFKMIGFDLVSLFKRTTSVLQRGEEEKDTRGNTLSGRVTYVYINVAGSTTMRGYPKEYTHTGSWTDGHPPIGIDQVACAEPFEQHHFAWTMVSELFSLHK